MQLAVVLLHLDAFTLALEASAVVSCRSLAADEAPSALSLQCLLPFGTTPSAQRRLLLLKKHPGDPLPLVFHGEMTFLELTAAALEPLPPLLQARRCWPAAKALIKHQGQVYLLLEASQLEAQLATADAC